MAATVDAFLHEVAQLTTSAEAVFSSHWENATLLSTQLLLVFIVFSWLGQVTTGYWSFVDRLWSITPPLYALVFAALNPTNARLGLLATLAWAIIRAWFKANDPTYPVLMQLFSFAFVAVYQHILIWLLVAPPCYVILHLPAAPLGAMDFVLVGLFALALVVETVVDEQQWAFQSLKHALTPAQRKMLGGDYVRGFRSTGVFAASRHLNFFCEQSMWWIVALFASAAGASGYWYLIGPLLLTLLFLGSTTMTEAVSVSKYPAYAAYQRTTSAWVPWFPGQSLDGPQGAALLVAARSPEAAAPAPAVDGSKAAGAIPSSASKKEAGAAARGRRRSTSKAAATPLHKRS